MPYRKSPLPFLVLLACAAGTALAEPPAPPAAAAPATPVAAAPTAPVPAAPLVPAAQVEASLAHPDFILLDVRTPEEFRAGHVPGAINIPVQELDARQADVAALGDRPLVVYCRSGHRAGIALEWLAAHGRQKLSHLEGDMNGWVAAGRPVAKEP